MRFIRVCIIFPTYSTRREVVFLNQLPNQRIINNMGYKYPVTRRKEKCCWSNLIIIRVTEYKSVSDYYLKPNEQLFSYFMARTCCVRWDDNVVRFLLDEHPWLDFYCASSLIQQSGGRHVSPVVHIIVIPNQSVFSVSLMLRA